MKVLKISSLFGLLLLLTHLSHGEELLFTSAYSGELDGYHITSTRKLSKRDDDSYRFQSIAKHTIGKITETSDFKLVEGQIYPLRYHYKRNIFGFKKEEWINFDWQQNKATYKRKDKPENTFVHDIQAGVYDPSLYQLQLQRDAWLSEGAFADGKVTYDVIKHRKRKDMPFEFLGEETLKIGDEEYRTLKVEVKDDDSTRVTTVWLVPELNYHIGRIIHQDEDGDTYEILLEKYDYKKGLFDAIYPQNEDKDAVSTEP